MSQSNSAPDICADICSDNGDRKIKLFLTVEEAEAVVEMLGRRVASEEWSGRLYAALGTVVAHVKEGLR